MSHPSHSPLAIFCHQLGRTVPPTHHRHTHPPPPPRSTKGIRGSHTFLGAGTAGSGPKMSPGLWLLPVSGGSPQVQRPEATGSTEEKGMLLGPPSTHHLTEGWDSSQNPGAPSTGDKSASRPGLHPPQDVSSQAAQAPTQGQGERPGVVAGIPPQCGALSGLAG